MRCSSDTTKGESYISPATCPVGLQLDGRRQWELATKQPFQWVRGLRRPAFQVVGMHIDKQVNPATHGKVIAAKLSELGVARRRGR
jgi:hypothetical protein